MKRVIRNSTNIFGMSNPRSIAIRTLEGLSKELTNHLIKCVVYGRSLENGNEVYEHWIKDEICNYLDIANGITVKPKDKKLKSRDYLDTVFGYMGDARNDASVAVKMFKIENKRTKEYPDFNVSEELIDCVYETFQNVIKYMLPILVTKNELKQLDFVEGVHKSIRIFRR